MSKAPPPAVGRTFLGPVADLESHLPADWWRELFDSVYSRPAADQLADDAATAAETAALAGAAGLETGDRVLDLCCGQGRHVLALARQGFAQVSGVDRSGALIRLARRRAEREGMPAVFHEGDARVFRGRENSADAITLLGNAFAYFDDGDALRVLENAKRLLRAGGKLVLQASAGDWLREHFERRTWAWVDERHFLCRERSLSADGARLIARDVVVHAERGVIADQFYGERLYTGSALLQVLEGAGYRHVRLMADAVPPGQPGQPPRLLVTAEAPRKAPPAPSRGRRQPLRVAVVMGDTRLPDVVRRGGRYNPEDIESRERAKDALSDIPDMSFEYFERHDTLIADLERATFDLVLNFCDEGYNNDPFKELHIPALLEMLEAPYSGSPPATLGLCYDKALVRALAMSLDIPVPAETYVRAADQSATLPSTFPAIIKPNFGDGSMGITQDAVVHTPEALMDTLGRLNQEMRGRPLLVQEFLEGAEYSVALLGNPGTGMQALPILEVDYSGLDPALPRLLGYESKWYPESPYWRDIRYREAQLDAAQQRLMVGWAEAIFERLGCRDYARVDFRADRHGALRFLEVNPNPGWPHDGKLNFMAGFAGWRYSQLLEQIVRAAVARIAAQPGATPGALQAAEAAAPGDESSGA